MATYKVTKVRKESPPLNPAHKHLVGVLTDDGAYHPIQEVVDSIAKGDTWWTAAPEEPQAAIMPEPYCPKPFCMHGPYLASVPGESLASDLEKLPPG
jgi:hypothetical protein